MGNDDGRLFHQDRQILWNTIRTTFAGWHDRAIAALLLLAAVAAVRVWIDARAWTTAACAVLAVGILVGHGAGRMLATRLAFHASEGLLAADALHPGIRRRYMAAWHGVGLALLTLATLLARPSLLLVAIPAYLAGALVARVTQGIRIPKGIVGTTRPDRAVRIWTQRPIAGVAAALIFLLSLLPARTSGTNALMAIVGIETMLLALMLTRVDDAVVRFMTIAGHGSRRIVARHAGGVMSFLAIAVTGCWIVTGPVAAGIVAAVGAAMTMLLILRILTYRLHDRRFADMLVAILAGLLMLVAYSMPMALPLIALVMVWQLHRRARVKTWLLA
jgi:hypothetical protein